MTTAGFDALVAAAERQAFAGCDFSWLQGRMVEEPLAFDYVALVRSHLAGVAAMLDLGTGGGEVLSQFAPFPPLTVATEAYVPNAFLAARRLVRAGAQVVLAQGAPENWRTLATPHRTRPALPLREGAFDLVVDRHESYLPAEVFRVLRHGGRFITQQCGGTHLVELNDLVGAPRPPYGAWSLATARTQLTAVGFAIVAGEEEFTTTWFHDVGAVVYFLRALPWQAPDFRALDTLLPLQAIHRRIERDGPLAVRAHHFLIEAVRPDQKIV